MSSRLDSTSQEVKQEYGIFARSITVMKGRKSLLGVEVHIIESSSSLPIGSIFHQPTTAFMCFWTPCLIFHAYPRFLREPHPRMLVNGNGQGKDAQSMSEMCIGEILDQVHCIVSSTPQTAAGYMYADGSSAAESRSKCNCRLYCRHRRRMTDDGRGMTHLFLPRHKCKTIGRDWISNDGIAFCLGGSPCGGGSIPMTSDPYAFQVPGIHRAPDTVTA